MKMQMIRFLVAMGLVFAPLATEAQRKSSELVTVEERIVRSVEQNRPAWKHGEGTPIEGSGDVAIHHWISEDVGVGVTIVRYSSDEKAQKNIREFAHNMRGANVVQEDADEAYSVEGRSSSVVVRKANFLIYIDVNCKDSADEKDIMKEMRKLATKAVK